MSLSIAGRTALVTGANRGIGEAIVDALVAAGAAKVYAGRVTSTHSQATRAMLKGQGTEVFGVYPGPIDTRMAETIPFDKTSHSTAAVAIVAGVEAGSEEIFPDPMSQGMGAAYLADP